MNAAENLPLLALRGLSAFPNMLLNFDVERQMSVAALNAAMSADQQIFLLSQKDPHNEKPTEDDLYRIGTICQIKQMLKLADGGVRVLVEGISRGQMLSLDSSVEYIRARVVKLEEPQPLELLPETEVFIRRSTAMFERYVEMSSNLSQDSLANITDCGDPGYIADYITQNIYLRHSEKQRILEIIDPEERIAAVNKIMEHELDVLRVERRLNRKTHERMERSRRESILREQLRVIKSELGEGDEDEDEFAAYHESILQLKLPKESEDKLLKELSRLEKQPYGSAEAAVLRTYLDTCLELPWNTRTEDRVDIEEARNILDRDHYGLTKVKDRIIEYLAVRQLAPGVKGMVLCLVGPPGTGKTSIAMSLASALNRKLGRISLGGVHDEAEIRGHRKTYVGAMPGRIMAAMKQAGSKNAILLLDEIDKLGSDYKGDPSSALLETLDSEQNYSFRDHYLEIPFDLSEVMFITTANTTSTIPRPLLDRMEVIELTSYTDEEKLHIADDHLIPKQRKKHGLTAKQLKITDDAVREIIMSYTRESGVRILEREIASICRKAAVTLAKGEKASLRVTAKSLKTYLGAEKFKNEQLWKKDEVGLARGLAWTSVGGEILDVEVNVLEGNGKLELTGNLGDVMKESAKAALTYIRSRCTSLGIEPDFYKTKDIHLHFPEGAVPKDGPSAGITMAVALISALTGAPVRRDVAMTGEITLRGRILPIGGLNEKTMAALRSGVSTVIIPADNENDLAEIDPNVKNALNFVMAAHIDDILDTAIIFPKPVKAQKKSGSRKEPADAFHAETA